MKNLVEENIKLVPWIYHNKIRKTEFVMSQEEDIISEGYIGLIKAAKTYNKDKSKFVTYAGMCIFNQMLMYLRKNEKHAQVVSLDQKTREITGLKVGDRVMLIAEKDTLTIKKI